MVCGALTRVAVLSAASVLIGATVTPAPAPTTPGPQREQVVQFGRYDYTVDTTHSLLTQANNWPFQVLQRGYEGQVTSLRNAQTVKQPMTFLFYADPMVIRPSDFLGYTTALPASWVQMYHPDWLLRDVHGNMIGRSNGDGDIMMDPGNPGYQQLAGDNLVAIMAKEGWAGVMLDELNQTWAWTIADPPARYPTEQSWTNAEVALVTTICGKVMAAGKLCLTNTGDYFDDEDFWNSITDLNSGSSQEFYMALDQGLGGAPASATIENGWWLPSEQRLFASQFARKQGFFHAYAASPDLVDYALGSYLLAWQGYGTFAASTVYDGTDLWTPAFDAARKLGQAASQLQFAGKLIWRPFQHGYVIVNPHDTPQTAFVQSAWRTLPAASAQIVAY
jgi:hypothetical protein